uniref:Uncharacterized protein n=1 Tax=Romanomermis culicivorax TaxID=13658 RepID=A0A915KYQ1_ROMCU
MRNLPMSDLRNHRIILNGGAEPAFDKQVDDVLNRSNSVNATKCKRAGKSYESSVVTEDYET